MITIADTEQIQVDVLNTLAKESAARERDADGRDALEQVGPSVLDPIQCEQQPSARDDAQP